jgi:hypothetical protein
LNSGGCRNELRANDITDAKTKTESFPEDPWRKALHKTPFPSIGLLLCWLLLYLVLIVLVDRCAKQI